ncbi:MAG: FAD-dependent oxidoreductase [Erysipelotrichaceae bacterium]|nr:FAD-dependent oxidoreductase [Erysipelotrichaceae bacterium]
MLKINNVKVGLNDQNYRQIISQLLNLPKNKINNVRLVKQSVDARRKNKLAFICSFTFETADEHQVIKLNRKVNLQQVKEYHYPKVKGETGNVIVVGSGPAGLFCAYNLARSGHKVTMIEQGAPVEQRQKDVARFLQTGQLDPSSNVQFGEGGAGTFSDGKLTTGVKDVRKDFILETFVQYGAHDDILYEAKPHIGSDVLVSILKNMRQMILENGGKIHFNTKMVDIQIENNQVKAITTVTGQKEAVLECDKLVLALGHSARDSFRLLHEAGLDMEAKPFAVGLRIEHGREFINESQYGKFADHPRLKAASYKLAVHPDQRGVYTFCMCPGGIVINASSHEEMLVVNGMSDYRRDRANSNSAILVTVNHEDYGDGLFSGMEFQEELEKKAFALGGGNYHVPVEKIEDYLGIEGNTMLDPSVMPGHSYQDLSVLFSREINDALKKGLHLMNGKIPGFTENAILTGVETRSSSPLRIKRDEHYCSNIAGIYPIGEGAGYAGGIMSSAIDGLKCSEFLAGGK